MIEGSHFQLVSCPYLLAKRSHRLACLSSAFYSCYKLVCTMKLMRQKLIKNSLVIFSYYQVLCGEWWTFLSNLPELNWSKSRDSFQYRSILSLDMHHRSCLRYTHTQNPNDLECGVKSWNIKCSVSCGHRCCCWWFHPFDWRCSC